MDTIPLWNLGMIANSKIVRTKRDVNLSYIYYINVFCFFYSDAESLYCLKQKCVEFLVICY